MQRTAGAALASRGLMTVHGKRSQVSIVIPGQQERLAVQAFALACLIVVAMCSEGRIALYPPHSKHARHELPRLLAAS